MHLKSKIELFNSNSLFELPPPAFHNAMMQNLTLYLYFLPLAFHNAMI